MGSELFKRAYGVLITDDLGIPKVEITELRVSFRITKTLNKDPNQAEIKIYNLAEKSRSELSQPDLTIALSAGYEETEEVIFEGDIRTCLHSKESTEWVTTVTAGDGDKALAESRVNETFAAGTPVAQVIDKVGGAFSGVDVTQAIARLKAAPPDERPSLLWTIFDIFKNGYVSSGQVREEFDKLMKGIGKGDSWSIQEGKLLVLGPTDITVDIPVQLKSDAGLVGNVSSGTDGVMTAQSLLQPGLTPGRQVNITSAAYINAATRIERVVHNGDTHGNNWFSDLELKVL